MNKKKVVFKLNFLSKILMHHALENVYLQLEKKKTNQ